MADRLEVRVTASHPPLESRRVSPSRRANFDRRQGERMLGAPESDLLSPAEFFLLAVVGSAGLAALVSLFVRPVPRDHAVFVSRADRVRRTRGEGVVLVVPLLDHVERVSLRPTTVEPLVVRAWTADGLHVVVTASAVIRVVDLERAAALHPSVFTHVADTVERLTGDAIERLELPDLVNDLGPTLRAELRARASALAEAGVALDWLEVDSTEVAASSMAAWAAVQDGHASRR